MLIAMAVYDTVENKRTWMTDLTLRALCDTVNWARHTLFVVDNGSCPETHAKYRTMGMYFSFQVLYNGENLGAAKAINRAWRHRQAGEHCVKMDNDVVIYQPGWADRMTEVFERDPTIGIVGLKRKDLAEAPWADGDMKSTLRMLPHVNGQSWIVVEEVKGVIGTCQAYSSALLDKIGYLVQPGVYGFDDSLSAVRARVAGFKSVFLPGIEIDHVDPGGDEYCLEKQRLAADFFPVFNTQVLLYEAGILDVYDDGGFDA